MKLQLTRMQLERPKDNGSFVGDPCARPGCCGENGRPGVLGVYSIKHKSGYVIRYLSCNVCNWKPEDNKLTLVDRMHSRDLEGQQFLFE